MTILDPQAIRVQRRTAPKMERTISSTVAGYEADADRSGNALAAAFLCIAAELVIAGAIWMALRAF